MADPIPPKLAYRKALAALRESEERYRLLVEGVRRYAIYMLDPAGTILTWNRGVEHLLGYGRKDFIGQSGTLCFTSEDRAAGAFPKELAEAVRLGEVTTDRMAVRKGGERFAVHDIVSALHDAAGSLIGFGKVTRGVFVAPNGSESGGEELQSAAACNAELVKTIALLHVEVEHRQRLEVELLSAVEEERQRVGRDLHDDLCQQLGGLAMIASAVATHLKRKNAAKESQKVEEIARLANATINSCRIIAQGLHPITLASRGLPAALEELAKRVPVTIKFVWPTTKRVELEPEVALHLYRIAEEAVSNAVKHGKAKRITIRLVTRAKTGEVVLSISDDGKGFDAPLTTVGMGLGNMKYRASAIGGSLSVDTQPRKGTRVSCTLPRRKAGV